MTAPHELTLEELAKLEKQLQVSESLDEYVCGRCHADYHLNDERNEPSALCDACAQEVASEMTPRLLAMARELIRLKSVLMFFNRQQGTPNGSTAKDDPVGYLFSSGAKAGWLDPLSPPATPEAELKGGE